MEKICISCDTSYKYYCQPCIRYLSNRPPLRQMTPREIMEEVESWRRCSRDNLPVQPHVWAERMSLILARVVYPGEIGRIAELIGETSVKHPRGKGLR